MSASTVDDISATASSGNVFEDLGIADAAAYMRKAELALKIADAIRSGGLTQSKAAARMQVTQPQVSLITRGLLDGFSLERLLSCLEGLGQTVRFVYVPVAETSASNGKRSKVGMPEKKALPARKPRQAKSPAGE